MYLYNISLIVEENQHDLFIDWLKQEWFPSLETKTNLLKMINSPHEGHTYCVQMTVKNEEEISSFQQQYLSVLQQHIAVNHNEKVFIFDSVMQYL